MQLTAEPESTELGVVYVITGNGTFVPPSSRMAMFWMVKVTQ